MPVRIRLQRHGKKGKPFYWIVAADGRAKRDGRYLEKLGIYDPNTNPAVVELNVDQAVLWLENGAKPSDTAKTLLSYRGAMMKHHLNGGVRKGAFSKEEADKRFAKWLEEKQEKIQSKIDGLDRDNAKDLANRMEAEKAVNQKRITEFEAEPEAEDTAETAKSDTTQVDQALEETATEKSATSEIEVNQEVPAVEETNVENISSEEPQAKKASDEAPAEEPKSEDTPVKEE
jgi:small subunit ribosomal protein S16